MQIILIKYQNTYYVVKIQHIINYKIKLDNLLKIIKIVLDLMLKM